MVTEVTGHHARVGVTVPGPIFAVAPDGVPLGHARPSSGSAPGAGQVTRQTSTVRPVAVPAAGPAAKIEGVAAVLAVVAQVGQEPKKP